MNNKLYHTLSGAIMFLCAAFTCSAGSGGADMDRFVSDLMAKMSLHEKIGQLNLCGAGDIDTGPDSQRLSAASFTLKP